MSPIVEMSFQWERRVQNRCRHLLVVLIVLWEAAVAVAKPALAPTLSLSFKGFNYVSYYNGAYGNADSLPALVGTNTNSVALAFEYGIDVQHSAVYADAAYTDSLTALAATIAEAKGRGLSVTVRPLIDFLDPAKIGSYHVGDWRSYYNPTDPAAFFASYKAMIVNVAQVAQANGATILCLGVCRSAPQVSDLIDTEGVTRARISPISRFSTSLVRQRLTADPRIQISPASSSVT